MSVFLQSSSNALRYLLHFIEISDNNSKMVQDRCIGSIKVDKEVICALLNGYVANDLEWHLTPKPSQFLHFLLPFISS